jgi:predicted transcriptional regulator
MAKCADGDERNTGYEAWFAAAVREGIAAADRGELVPHDQVMQDVRARIAKASKDRR